MKRLTSFLVALFLATTALWAYDFKSGDLYYNITNSSDKKVEVTYQKQYSSDNYKGLTSVTIPTSVTYDGTTYSVTSIGEYAFYGCTSLTSVTIPNSVASIGEYAFCGCTGLTFITIPNSVTNIGMGITDRCPNITSIVVDSDNNYYDSRDNCNAIIETKSNVLVAGCQTTIIPNTIVEIGNRAFSGCKRLTTPIPNTIIRIGDYAFSGCDITSITIPNVTHIGEGAFCYCDSLSSVTIGDNVRTIYGYTFMGCHKLSNIVLNNNIDTIGYGAFYECNIKSISLPDSLKYINDIAFCKCYNLTSVTIPRNVIHIGVSAFACTNLMHITIPKSVTNIEYGAFSDCPNLKTIEVEAKTPPLWDGDRVFENCPIDTIYIPCGTKAAYTSIHWGGFDDDKFVEMECPPFGQCGGNLYWSYEDDTLSITGTGDMYDYQADSANASPWLLFRDSITTITFPEGITYIGTHAFRQLPLLTEVTIPNAVEEIDESAFAGCTALGKVVIGSGNSSRLTTMGDSVFIDSRKLYEIHIAATEPPIADRTTFLNYNVHLYVPCESKDKYDLDMVFGDFKYIECLDTDTPVEDFSVTPAQTSAKFVWGAPSNASTYTLDLQQEDAPFFTLVFNATGQLHSISLAPIGSQVRLTAAEKAGNGFTFNATGLTPCTLYDYDLTIRDAAEVALQNYTGYFYTTSDIPTDTEDVDNNADDDTTPRKVFRDGQVYILRNGKMYTVTGMEVH